MELKYLQTFRTITEEGSYSKAAQKLNYTQSTITFQINQLEQEFSTNLFEKIGRNMVLTKSGAQLIPYANNVLSSIEKMRCFKNDLAEYEGNLHIGVGETLLCYQLPYIVKEFRKLAPKIKFFLRSMNCYDIRNNLLDGTLDMGISYLPRFTVQSELDKGELIEIPTNIPNSNISAICAHHKNKWISPAMKLFISLIKQDL